MFVVKRSLVSASQTDDFRSDCGQSIRVKRFSFHYFFFLIGGRKKSFRVNVEVRCHLVYSMRWGTSHLVLCKFLNLLFIYLFISHCGHHFLFTLIFQGTWHHTVIVFFWCCVREILCKTMMKGSLKIRHRLFIKIYVYVFQL